MAGELEGARVLKKEQMGQLVLTIKVSKDKLGLYVDSAVVQSKDKITINKDTISLMLKEVVSPKILNVGVLDAIAAAANAGKSLQDRKVAHGSAPEDGQDGRPELIVRTVEIPAQSTDTRFVKEIQRVVPGMILGIIHPPTEGKNGIDVFGEEAKPKPGKAWKLAPDRSVVQKASYDEKGVQYIVAHTYGFFVREKDRFKVLSVLPIKADVDLTSGDIDCMGKVDIAGDVAKGFKVQARDDIEIKGGTHGSNLNSRCGSIRAGGLVLGGPGISVSAGLNFTAAMVQGLKLWAEADIRILTDARDSELKANGTINMKEGHLFGGEAIALGGVEARIVGSEGGIRTVVGSRSRAEVEAELEQLKAVLEEQHKLEETLATKLGPLGDLKSEKLPVLEAQQAKKLNEFLLKLFDIKILREIQERRVEKLREALEREPWFQFNFGSVVHKGVVIKIGEDEFIFDNYKTGPCSYEYSATSRAFQEVKYKELAALRPRRKVDPAKG